MIPIFAHHNKAKYASENPRNIVPTSLSNQNGFHSIARAISDRLPNNIPILDTHSSNNALCDDISGYWAKTTNSMSNTIVKNPILESHDANPYTPSNQLIALTNIRYQATVSNNMLNNPNSNITPQGNWKCVIPTQLT